MKDVAKGVILVLVTSAVLMVIPEGLVLPLVAIFMGVASGVYVGFALKDPEAKEAPIQWRRMYNTIRPHSACGRLPPAPEALKPSPWFLRIPQLQGPQTAAGLT